MTEKTRKPYPGQRIKYPFKESSVGDLLILPVFNTLRSAMTARCAAHMISHKRGWKFKTRIRETDAGKYELKAERVK